MSGAVSGPLYQRTADDCIVGPDGHVINPETIRDSTVGPIFAEMLTRLLNTAAEVGARRATARLDDLAGRLAEAADCARDGTHVTDVANIARAVDRERRLLWERAQARDAECMSELASIVAKLDWISRREAAGDAEMAGVWFAVGAQLGRLAELLGGSPCDLAGTD